MSENRFFQQNERPTLLTDINDEKASKVLEFPATGASSPPLSVARSFRAFVPN